MSSHRKGLLSDMPATIDHKATIDESDQDSRIAATASAPRASAQSHTNDIIFGAQDLEEKTVQVETPENASGYTNSLAGRQQQSSADHNCVTLDSNEYFAAMKRNPVVESYCRAWHTEPAWLPRVCGLSLSAETTTDANTEGNTKYLSSHFSCSPGSDGSLARILLEFASKLGTKNAVMANAHYTSDFLVPAGMPYMVSTSPIFGLIIRTPFYSTIPSAFPDIPDALFSMRNLTIARVIRNPVFRHEFVFNTSLKVEAPSQLTDAINSRSFWRQLEHETMQIVSHPIARAPTPMLPIFLNETKKIMLSVVPCSLSAHISYYFDLERLLDVSETTDTQMLDDLLAFMHAILEACVLPMRKHWVQKMREYFSQASQSPKALVSGFRIAIWLLNQTKIDFINAQVKDRAVSLNDSVIAVENSFYKSLAMDEPNLSLEACEWLAAQPTIGGLCTICNIPDESVAQLCNNTVANNISKLVAGFVWCVLRRNRSQVASPAMFALDTRRIKSMQHQLNHFVRERLDTDVSTRCPKKYRPHLPRLMSGRELEQSPLFLLIERRVLGSVALQTFKKLMGVAPPEETLQPGRHKASASQKSSGLAALTSNIATLLALHWRAAGFLYEAADCGQ